jgi:hypothetical protein
MSNSSSKRTPYRRRLTQALGHSGMHLDLSGITSSVVGGALATVLAAAILAALAWLAGPLRWLLQNHGLKVLIGNGRRFRLVFNPATQASKVITLVPGGTIGDGNVNEHSWRIRHGALEILASDARLYSRFRHNRAMGQLQHTKDADCRSIHGQYLQPLFVRVESRVA